jgi:vacuolar protein sorting-associated protein 72
LLRITKLLEDEIEQDEVFWNQDALKDVGCSPPLFLPFSWAAAAHGELRDCCCCACIYLQFLSAHVLLLSPQEDNDDNYEEEQDAGDEFDSDFDRYVRSLPSPLFTCFCS